MRKYQINHLSSLAARCGVAKRRCDFRAINRTQRAYKLHRLGYKIDAFLRHPVVSFSVVLVVVIGVFMPLPIASMLEMAKVAFLR